MPFVPAYAAPAAGAPLEPTSVEIRDLGDHDVLIDVRFTGLCHTDVHLTREEWGPGIFPMVPGHEISGIVSAVGSAVTTHSVGDRVGVGCLVDSCGECDRCLAGREQQCVNGATDTYGVIGRDGRPTYGGYAKQVVVRDAFVLRIPDEIPLDAAAPLLCAGITTFSPLKRWKAGPGTKVAVVGLGGVGHMAVKIAHAMGAEVTVLSQSLSKQEDGLRLGADDYRATSDPATFTALAGRFDLILSTVSAPIDLGAYLSLLHDEGTMVMVGIPDAPLPVHAFSLIVGNKVLAGSMIGGIAETQEMLDFCAAHGLGAEIETVAASEINDSYVRMLASDVRYRFVLDASTI
ncbi:MAG: NAD(P)-dependent alcohol dehydrogenase [Mycetocola sp.]